MNLFDALSTGGVGTALAIERAKKQELAQKAETMYGKALELEVQMKKAKEERAAAMEDKKELLKAEYALRTQFEKDTKAPEKTFEQKFREEEEVLKLRQKYELEEERIRMQKGYGTYYNRPTAQNTFGERSMLDNYYNAVTEAGATIKKANLDYDDADRTISKYSSLYNEYKKQKESLSKQIDVVKDERMQSALLRQTLDLDTKMAEAKSYIDSANNLKASLKDRARSADVYAQSLYEQTKPFAERAGWSMNQPSYNMGRFSEKANEEFSDKVFPGAKKEEAAMKIVDDWFRNNPTVKEQTFTINGKDVTLKNPKYEDKFQKYWEDIQRQIKEKENPKREYKLQPDARTKPQL